MARGTQFIPMLVKDSVREERATRHWFAHRQGGWSPIDIVLRSPLYETETWYDPRGQKKSDHDTFANQANSSLVNADYAEIEKRILDRNLKPDTGLSFAEMYGSVRKPE